MLCPVPTIFDLKLRVADGDPVGSIRFKKIRIHNKIVYPILYFVLLCKFAILFMPTKGSGELASTCAPAWPLFSLTGGVCVGCVILTWAGAWTCPWFRGAWSTWWRPARCWSGSISPLTGRPTTLHIHTTADRKFSYSKASYGGRQGSFVWIVWSNQNSLLGLQIKKIRLRTV